MKSGKITKDTKKTIEAYAKAATDDDVIVADARGKLVKIKTAIQDSEG
jgi:hypothetical protein